MLEAMAARAPLRAFRPDIDDNDAAPKTLFGLKPAEDAAAAPDIILANSSW